MIKKLFGSLREYKTPTLLTLFAMVFEVFFEVLIPFYTADLVNSIKAGVQMSEVGKTGLILLLMAMLSLGCGAAGAVFGSRAATGFAKKGDFFFGRDRRNTAVLTEIIDHILAGFIIKRNK